MRALVVLAAIVFKIWFVARMMTPRDAIILKIVAFALLVLMLTIMGGQTEDKRPAEFICSDPAQRQPSYDYELCEFKQRDVRSLASSQHEGFIA